MITNEQYKRLPRWAQKEIDRLQMRLNESNDRIRELLTTPSDGGARTTLVDHTEREPFALGNYPSIRFRYGHRWDEAFEVRLLSPDEAEAKGGKKLIVRNLNSDWMAILPSASNSIYLSLEEQ